MSHDLVGNDTRTCPQSLGSALRELAGPGQRGDRIKAAIDRASRRAGLSYWRAFDIWYRKARRIEEFEADAIRSAVDKKRKEDARRELHELRLQIERLEARLNAADADFYSPQIDGIRSSLRAPR